MINIKYTNRGFVRGDFLDRYDQKCSIQESSCIDDHGLLWLGVDKDTAGKESSRIHLTKELAKELVDLLNHFIDTGSLPYDNTKDD